MTLGENTELKLQAHYCQSSFENATPSSGTYPLLYLWSTPGPGNVAWAAAHTQQKLTPEPAGPSRHLERSQKLSFKNFTVQFPRKPHKDSCRVTSNLPPINVL